MTSKEQFLTTLDREFATTLRVLRAFPADKVEYRPGPTAKTARELAWTFALERGLALRVWNDEFSQGMISGSPPAPPETWDALIAAIEKSQEEYRAVVEGASEEDLGGEVTFFTGPKTMGKVRRIDWIWFLLFDEIHHRGQFSIYLRLAGGKVPSIYGPSGDEPWI